MKYYKGHLPEVTAGSVLTINCTDCSINHQHYRVLFIASLNKAIDLKPIQNEHKKITKLKNNL